MYKETVLIVLFAVLTVCEKPIVNTTHGKVLGAQFKTLLNEINYYGFMGIPYAAAPVKELRFLPPQPIEPWQDVLTATKEKPACIQKNYNVKKNQQFGIYGDEDCLYLDIFTPAIDLNNRPVIVFLYNENFKISYNKTKDYAPDFFMEEDVIIVTISHRLSVFGFLSFEDETLSGNAGLKDVVAGLQWIKDNIGNFGGDPERITLMGWKGGAVVVELLIHSNAKELFKSAILLGETQFSTKYLQQDVRERAFKLAQLLDYQSSSSVSVLKFLSDASTTDLLQTELRASPDDYTKIMQRSVVSFSPIVEKNRDGLMLEYPENSTENINIPIMIGFSSREGFDASVQYLNEPRYLSFLKRNFPLLMPRRLTFSFDPSHDGYVKATKEIKQFYFPSGEVEITNVPEYMTYIGDVTTAYSVDYMTRFYANKSTEPIYYYHFNYFSELNENKMQLLKVCKEEHCSLGAASGDELCYLFKCPRLKDTYINYNKTESKEILMLQKLVRLWANFVKHGNPTPVNDDILDGLKWPAYDNNAKQYLHIDNEITVKQNLYSTSFKFWDNFIEKWENNAVNGVITDTLTGRNTDEL